MPVRHQAPISSENFRQYVEDGFFDETIFHRVVPGVVIQGGGHLEDMSRKPTRDPIKNEADNGLKNEVGTIAMARTNVVDSATNQFFINTVDNSFLDHRSKDPQGWGYTVFGKVVAGMDVVAAIDASQRVSSSSPMCSCLASSSSVGARPSS